MKQKTRPTFRQHYNASYNDDEDDEEFGEGEDILHVARQLDTQTVDADDQNLEAEEIYIKIHY